MKNKSISKRKRKYFEEQDQKIIDRFGNILEGSKCNLIHLYYELTVAINEYKILGNVNKIWESWKVDEIIDSSILRTFDEIKIPAKLLSRRQLELKDLDHKKRLIKALSYDYALKIQYNAESNVIAIYYRQFNRNLCLGYLSGENMSTKELERRLQNVFIRVKRVIQQKQREV